MNLNDLFADLGAPEPKATKAAPASPIPLKPRVSLTKPQSFVPAVTFCVETLWVKPTEIDVANPQHSGAFFLTPEGSHISHSYLAGPESQGAIQSLVDELIALRSEVILRENKLIGKMFAVARESRLALINPATAPVAATPHLFEEKEKE